MNSCLYDMENEKQFRKIAYFKKSNLDFTKFSVEPKAKADLDAIPEDGNLIIKLRINSPAVIEAVAPLTKEGIKKIVLDK